MKRFILMNWSKFNLLRVTNKMYKALNRENGRHDTMFDVSCGNIYIFTFSCLITFSSSSCSTSTHLWGEKSLIQESKEHPEALGYISTYVAQGFQMEHLVLLNLMQQKPVEMKEKCQLCKNFHLKSDE